MDRCNTSDEGRVSPGAGSASRADTMTNTATAVSWDDDDVDFTRALKELDDLQSQPACTAKTRPVRSTTKRVATEQVAHGCVDWSALRKGAPKQH